MIIRTMKAGEVQNGMQIKHNNFIMDVWAVHHYTDGKVGLNVGIYEIEFEQSDIVEVVE